MKKVGIKKRFNLLREYTIKEKINFSWPFKPSGDAYVETPKFEVLPQKDNIIETINELYDYGRIEGLELAEINIRFEVCVEDMMKVDIIATAAIN